LRIYIYLISILVTLLIICEGLKDNFKYAPNRIKFICTGIFAAMLLRYGSIIIFTISEDMRYLYLLKPLYFLNFLCILIAALTSIYILMRNDKIKFLYMFPLSLILILIYGYLIYKYPARLGLNIIYGYHIEFIGNPYIYIGYMLMNVFFIILSMNIYRANIDKKGIIFIVSASIGTILETMLYVLGKGIFIHLIIGDLLWMVTLNYAISKLKKSIITSKK
jgi:hypothetical protein